MQNMRLETMPEGVDPAVKQRARMKMVHWFTMMAHKGEFDDTATFESVGDLKRSNLPTLRDFLLETCSIAALSVGSVNHGAA